MFGQVFPPESPEGRAVELFRKAYMAQSEKDYARAIELYKLSIEAYPTAEVYTFLGCAYSLQDRYGDAIEACLKAIGVDPTYGNPYNDIGSYLVAQGDLWGCVLWFRRALSTTRYKNYEQPHLNLAHVYEDRHRPLDAARHYSLALEAEPGWGEATTGLRRVQALLN